MQQLSANFPPWCPAAAVSLVLEEKTALGLAEPPKERAPAKPLTEDEAERLALEERAQRAETEPMRIAMEAPLTLWSDYCVTNETSGRTYRVALRGWRRGESFCTCPDFRANTLGTCKHILRVVAFAKKKFPARTRAVPYLPERVAVHVVHGRELELRMQAPPTLPAAARALVAPLLGGPITDMHQLLGSLRGLAALGVEPTVYPDAEELIQQALFREHMDAVVAAIRRDPANHPLRSSLLKTPLLPYQLDGVAFASGRGRAVLADDMGLGKTIQGIGVAELLAREAGIGRVLVICPTSLKSQWRNEIERFSTRSAQLVVGGAAERAAHYANDCFFTLCNYEQVLRDRPSIERTAWDLIILDEGQRIKNWETRTSRVIKQLKSRFALVLSGTPLENRLEELYSVLQFVDGRRLGPAFRFLNRHRVQDEHGKTLGYRNLDHLREQLKPVLLRRTRQSVLMELPKRTNEIIRVAPTQQQLDLHDGNMQIVSTIVRKKFISEMDLLRLQKALLLCRLAANGTFLVDKQKPNHSSKLVELDALLGALAAEADRKIVLFSEWTTMLDLIEPLLNKHGLPFVRLDGGVPQKKRQGLVNEFQQNPACRLFLTTNAGSAGLNLQAANTVINVDLPWNPAVLEQRVARAHRMGQKRPVQVYLLVTEQTLEERLLGTLAAKQDLALAALDPDATAKQVNLASGMDELKRRLEVLLGKPPPPPLDAAPAPPPAEEEATRQRQRVAAAAGNFMAAAFQFLGELVPQAPPTAAARQAADQLKGQFRAAAAASGADGTIALTVTLPDAGVLDRLAETLASLLANAGKTG